MDGRAVLQHQALVGPAAFRMLQLGRHAIQWWLAALQVRVHSVVGRMGVCSSSVDTRAVLGRGKIRACVYGTPVQT